MVLAPVSALGSGRGEPFQTELTILRHDAIERQQEVQSLLRGNATALAPVVDVLRRQRLPGRRQLGRRRRQTADFSAKCLNDSGVPHAADFGHSV
jgi:hypothetical protein